MKASAHDAACASLLSRSVPSMSRRAPRRPLGVSGMRPPNSRTVPLLSPPGPLLEDDLPLDDHVLDQAPPERRILLDTVLEPVVRDDARVELLGERQDEVVG